MDFIFYCIMVSNRFLIICFFMFLYLLNNDLYFLIAVFVISLIVIYFLKEHVFTIEYFLMKYLKSLITIFIFIYVTNFSFDCILVSYQCLIINLFMFLKLLKNLYFLIIVFVISRIIIYFLKEHIFKVRDLLLIILFYVIEFNTFCVFKFMNRNTKGLLFTIVYAAKNE